MAERRARRPRRGGQADAGVTQLEHRADHLDTARILDPVSHIYMLREWGVTCPRFGQALDETGLGLVRFLGRIRLDHRLITALVERWSPQTNTFILPVGEMTVTLEDVAVILGIQIDGFALIGPPVVGLGGRWETWPECCDELLGQHPVQNVMYHNPRNPNEQSQFTMGQAVTCTCVPLRWLKWRFARESYEGMTHLQLVQCVRAYVLYMIGCFLLPDTSGSEVHLQWLPLLENLALFSQYSIGGAVLAHLYRELTESVRPTRASIAGCLHLLQVWAWEHFYIGRPTSQLPPWSHEHGMPLGYRWSEGWTRENPLNSVVHYRNEFDILQSGQVIWEPYTDDISSTLPAISNEGSGIWTARVPLICWVRVEWYLPDRVLRQFGCQQHIDLETIPADFKRVDARGKASTDWTAYHRKECDIWERRYDFIIHPSLVDKDPRRALNIYMTWYKSWARLYLVHVPTEEPQDYYPRAGVERELVHFVDDAERAVSHLKVQMPIEEWAVGRDSIMTLCSDIRQRLHLHHYTDDTPGPSTSTPGPSYTQYDSYTDPAPSYTDPAPSYADPVSTYADPGPLYTQYDAWEIGASQTYDSQQPNWEPWSSEPWSSVPMSQEYGGQFYPEQGPEVAEEAVEEPGGYLESHRTRNAPDRYTPGSGALRRGRRRG